MADIVHEAQDTHLCALFIKARGVGGDYEYALDAANSAAKYLQAIQAELPATSPLARDCQMRVFGTGVLGTRYCRVPGSWYRAEGCVGPDR